LDDRAHHGVLVEVLQQTLHHLEVVTHHLVAYHLQVVSHHLVAYHLQVVSHHLVAVPHQKMTSVETQQSELV
jgi:hypothetical protein